MIVTPEKAPVFTGVTRNGVASKGWGVDRGFRLASAVAARFERHCIGRVVEDAKRQPETEGRFGRPYRFDRERCAQSGSEGTPLASVYLWLVQPGIARERLRSSDEASLGRWRPTRPMREAPSTGGSRLSRSPRKRRCAGDSGAPISAGLSTTFSNNSPLEEASFDHQRASGAPPPAYPSALSAWAPIMIQEIGFAANSSLEGSGFEISVPPGAPRGNRRSGPYKGSLLIRTFGAERSCRSMTIPSFWTDGTGSTLVYRWISQKNSAVTSGCRYAGPIRNGGPRTALA